MYFSERFEVDPKEILDYGAIDISLVCDIPLFIDPMLIFNSDKQEYKELHESIITYFHFLYKKSKQKLSSHDILTWFNFGEIRNNWLGYSMVGNKGLALGEEYAQYLYRNIEFAVQTSSITRESHIEKVMLLKKGSGKDKISDLTVNLIKGYLCEYTQRFAKRYISPKHLKTFIVDRVAFNYETESFITKKYTLPFIQIKGMSEFVLLTPGDILRTGEPSINIDDFYDRYMEICSTIDDDNLRALVNNYISQAVYYYESNQRKNHLRINQNTRKRVAREAFTKAVDIHPELYDYYIRLKEEDAETIIKDSEQERNRQIEIMGKVPKEIISMVYHCGYKTDLHLTAREEAKARLAFFKHIIEDCDGYKLLYLKGERIAKERELQGIFRLVWFGTSYKVDAESNNGRGQTDFIVSKGISNQSIVEFKMASNPNLEHVFKQVKVYEKANSTKDSIIVIFYFTGSEYETALRVIKEAGQEGNIGESVFMIDCRKDNKESASKVRNIH